MVKFFKSKRDADVRMVVDCSENGENKKIIAVIGEVKTLLKNDIIFHDNTENNMNKWLIVFKNGDIIECNNLDEAKAHFNN